MSKLVLCSVFDTSAQFYHAPQAFRATGAALRWFEDLVKNPEAKELYAHRDQFQLFYVADFDDFDGSFVAIKPQLLVHGSAFDV